MPVRKNPPLPEATEPEPADEPAREPRTFDTSRLSLIAVLLLAASALFVSGFTLGARVATTPGTPADEEARWAPFWDVYKLIRQEYAGSPQPSPDQLVEGAIKGMIGSLDDPYSYYQSPEDFRNALLNVGGQAEGIGVAIQLQPALGSGTTDCPVAGGGCELAIVRTIPGSPAEDAKLEAGDVIAAVDGVALDGLNIDQIVALIKGQRDTSVTLTILRGTSRTDVTIVRQVYDRIEVEGRVLADGKVQYIELHGFNGPAYSQFRLALADALEEGRHSIIVDLRGNGGGYLPAAVYIASQFVESGTLLYQVDKDGALTEITTNTKPDEPALALDPSIEVVMLVDGGTASAAEILAGALQTRGRAILVGQTTYGKGVVQEWLPLPDDKGGIHLTIARWLLPNKVWIQGQGLSPDIAVSTEGARAGTDPILDAALKALGYPPEPSPSPSPSPSATATPSPSPLPS
jgi:carboxyl-terminal processing protease